MGRFRSLQTELTIVFIGILVLTSLLGIIFFTNLESISSSFEEHIHQIVPTSDATEQALLSLNRSGSEAAKAVIIEEFQNLSDVQKFESDFNTSVLNFREFTAAIIYGSESEEFKQLDGGLIYAEWIRSGNSEKYIIPKSPEKIASKFKDINKIFDEFVEKNERVFALKKRSLRLEFERQEDETINAQMSGYLFEIDQLRNQMRDEMDEVLLAQRELSREQFDKVTRSINQTRNLTIITLVVITAIAIIISNSFAKRILILPIKRLQRGSKEIASGNYAFKVRVDSNDEIGALANDFNKMARQLRNRDKKIAELTESLRILNKNLRHDVLNDLTVIKGNIDTYFEYKDDKQDIDELLSSIKEASGRSIDFIHKMKEVEQSLSTGIKLDVVNVRPILETLREKNKELDIDIYGHAKAMADDALASVFQNILGNISRHSGVKAAKVRIVTHGNNVIVKISDEGKGIPDEAKEKIFEEGFVYGETGNTGLGLFVSRKTVKRYGGHIHVADNTPKGTIFVITIPAA